MYIGTILKENVRGSRNDFRKVEEINNNSFRSNGFNNKEQNEIVVVKGGIYYANLGDTRGSIQGGKRPVIVTSNRDCNRYSSVITVVPLTSQLHKKKLPVHVLISAKDGLKTDSIALVEGITSFNKSDLMSKIGDCTEEEMIEIEKAIQVQNGIQLKEEINSQPGRYFSASEKFQNEVFDIYKAKRMAKAIKELESFISQSMGMMNVQVNETLNESLDILISELKEYCEKHNKDYKLFYKPIINNMVISKGVAMGAL